MRTRYPDYPRKSDGDIPEPLCYELLRIWPEHGGAYIWDMNGMCISISCVTNIEGNEPLDDELEEWQKKFEWKPLNDRCDPTWDSETEQSAFDEHILFAALLVGAFLHELSFRVRWNT